jgi:hypothetical protein
MTRTANRGSRGAAFRKHRPCRPDRPLRSSRAQGVVRRRLGDLPAGDRRVERVGPDGQAVDVRAVATRLEFRQLSVEDLTDEARYDLAWIPAPLVPEPAFSTGTARIASALRQK